MPERERIRRRKGKKEIQYRKIPSVGIPSKMVDMWFYAITDVP